MNIYIYYCTKNILGKDKKIYKKKNYKKKYIKLNKKYILLSEYKKHNKLKKKYIKKGGNIEKDSSILETGIKFDENGNYIQSPMCQAIINNPEQYGLTKEEINNLTNIDSQLESYNKIIGGKNKNKKKKNKGGNFIDNYLKNINK